jgi:FRG domain
MPAYPYEEFSSIDELCSSIRQATQGWDTRWYRGAKSPGYALLPKLLREPDLAKREGYISVEFRRRGKSQLSNIEAPFEWLCAMQHFGLPTRLLDWSESLSVALYFTTRPFGRDLVAPTIWVLDPFELVRLSFPDYEAIPLSGSPHATANADIAFDELEIDTRKSRTKYPLPVAPDFLFSRLAAQNGAFTIQGTDTGSLEQIIPVSKRKMLRKFVARQSARDAIYNCIDLIRPSSDAMFPDVEGMKEYIV